jgi:predicted metal-dependent hydrolase
MPEIKIDKIIRTSRRTVALVVMPDTSIVIRAPHRVSIEYIQNFVNQKRGWIEKKQKYITEIGWKRSHKKFTEGEKFYLAGNELWLRIQPGSKPGIWVEGESLHITEACLTNPLKYLAAWYRDQAKALIPERVQIYASQLGFKYKSVQINGAKTRWASCGHKNSLNFSWRLVMAPIEIIDYVIIHELVHTEIKNHSLKFYSRLKEVMPDYNAREKWFKHNIGFAEL